MSSPFLVLNLGSDTLASAGIQRAIAKIMIIHCCV